MRWPFLLAAALTITTACSTSRTFQTRALEAWEPEAGWLAESNPNSGRVRIMLDSQVTGTLDISAYVLYGPEASRSESPECFKEYYSPMALDTYRKVASEVFHLKQGKNHIAVPLDAYLPGRCKFQPSLISFLVRELNSSARTHPIFNRASVEIKPDVPPLSKAVIYCGVCAWNPESSVTKDLFVNCGAEPNSLRISTFQQHATINFSLIPSKDACGPLYAVP